MARRQRFDLLVNATGAGASIDWPGGQGVFFVESATFGGGTVGLQFQGPNGNWVPVNDFATSVAISLTTVASANFLAPAGPLRAVATTATAVYASVVGMPANTMG